MRIFCTKRIIFLSRVPILCSYVGTTIGAQPEFEGSPYNAEQLVAREVQIMFLWIYLFCYGLPSEHVKRACQTPSCLPCACSHTHPYLSFFLSIIYRIESIHGFLCPPRFRRHGKRIRLCKVNVKPSSRPLTPWSVLMVLRAARCQPSIRKMAAVYWLPRTLCHCCRQRKG